MALITCPDCEKQISSSAPACIHCGRPTLPTPEPERPAPESEGPPSQLAPGAQYAKVCPICDARNQVRAEECFNCSTSLASIASRFVGLPQEYSEASAQPRQQNPSSAVSGFSVLGGVLLVLGVVGLVVTFNMSTTVATGGEFVGSFFVPRREVHNIGLINQRQNSLIVSSVVTLIGVVFIAVGAFKREPR